MEARYETGAAHAPHRVFNIGNYAPIALFILIETLEKALECESINNILPMQQGNVHAPHAGTAGLHEWVGFMPNAPLEEGIANFADWCQSRSSPANLDYRAN